MKFNYKFDFIWFDPFDNHLKYMKLHAMTLKMNIFNDLIIICFWENLS